QYGNFYRNFWGELAEKAVAVSVERFGFPFIVKVPDQGSSCGVFKVKDKSSALFAFKEIYKTSSTLIVEDCVEGLEVSCGVLESNGIAKALTPTAIIPEKSDFFDMASKYESGGASEITPAPLPDEVTEMVRKTALEAHKCLGCLIYSRTDMIIKDEVIFVLETNTLPGFTKTSLLPQNAAASGIEYKTLLSQIVNESIEGFSGHKV
ncbi:MAG: ATP-grasp domain-containing protein, partial [Fibrobacterota bacterium]